VNAAQDVAEPVRAQVEAADRDARDQQQHADRAHPSPPRAHLDRPQRVDHPAEEHDGAERVPARKAIGRQPRAGARDDPFGEREDRKRASEHRRDVPGGGMTATPQQHVRDDAQRNQYVARADAAQHLHHGLELRVQPRADEVVRVVVEVEVMLVERQHGEQQEGERRHDRQDEHRPRERAHQSTSSLPSSAASTARQSSRASMSSPMCVTTSRRQSSRERCCSNVARSRWYLTRLS